MLTQAQIDARLPVWCALSELFVDTEFDDLAADSVARALRKSGLPLIELERILRDEVAPTFHRNAFAGNWTGWPPEEVRRAVTAHLAASEGLAARLARPLLRLVWMAGIAPAWQAVRDRLVHPYPPPG